MSNGLASGPVTNNIKKVISSNLSLNNALVDPSSLKESGIRGEIQTLTRTYDFFEIHCEEISTNLRSDSMECVKCPI